MCELAAQVLHDLPPPLHTLEIHFSRLHSLVFTEMDVIWLVELAQILRYITLDINWNEFASAGPCQKDAEEVNTAFQEVWNGMPRKHGGPLGDYGEFGSEDDGDW